MRYASGPSFEDVISGRHSRGAPHRDSGTLTSGIKSIIADNKCLYPDSRVGALLYFGVKAELERLGVNTAGLSLKRSTGSMVDEHHYTDMFFYLPFHFPRYEEHIVTIDLFNLDSEIAEILRNYWVANSSGEGYSEKDYQSDLFLYKSGVSALERIHPGFKGWTKIFRADDLRFYTSVFRKKILGRPENHFILIPEYAENRGRRREFIKLVAGYFAKVARQNTAQMSH